MYLSAFTFRPPSSSADRCCYGVICVSPFAPAIVDASGEKRVSSDTPVGISSRMADRAAVYATLYFSSLRCREITPGEAEENRAGRREDYFSRASILR